MIIKEVITNSCFEDELAFYCSKASDCDILHYRNLAFNYLHKHNIRSSMKCTDINCKSFDHCEKLVQYTSRFVKLRDSLV